MKASLFLGGPLLALSAASVHAGVARPLDEAARLELDRVAPVSEQAYRVAEPGVLRERPRSDAAVVIAVPANAGVRLGQRIYNQEGYWWYAEFDGRRGWLADDRLVAGR